MAKALPERGLIFYPGRSIELPTDGSSGQVLTRGTTSNDLTWTTVSGGSGGSADPATTTTLGTVKLSSAPADSASPIAVGTNDSRMTDSRTPSGSAGGDLTGTYPNPTLGTGVVSNSTLAALSVSSAKIQDSAIVSAKLNDGAVSAAKLSTSVSDLLPTGGQKDALAGSSGTPGSANLYVTSNDSRLVPSGGTQGQVLTRGATGTSLGWSNLGFTRKTLNQSVTVAAGSSADVSLSMAATFGLMRVSSDKACRIRLYATSADREADRSRLVGGVPGIDAGLLAEIILSSELDLRINPMQMGSNMEATPSNTILAIITNSSASANLSLEFTYLPVEVI